MLLELYPDSQIFRSFSLAASPAGPELYEACQELAALNERGWKIEISGNPRAGDVTIRLTKESK